jgi:Forkhead domain
MRGSSISVRSSSSLFDHCNLMEMHRDDSCLQQPLLMSERLSYVDTQHQYYDPLQGLSGQDSIACPIRIPTNFQRHATHPFTIGLSMNVPQSNEFRDTWRYHEAMESQEANFESDCQPSPSPYLNQELAYAAQITFDESYKMTESSDIEAYREDIASSSTSPKMDLSPAVEVWPLVPEESVPAFRSEEGLLTRDSQDDEEAPGDKPYARLIHEALMQAPGHRMMLREIYDWFVQNTTKPSESGTNGWQNSIRHNLSMNQVSVYKPPSRMRSK